MIWNFIIECPAAVAFVAFAYLLAVVIFWQEFSTGIRVVFNKVYGGDADYGPFAFGMVALLLIWFLVVATPTVQQSAENAKAQPINNRLKIGK